MRGDPAVGKATGRSLHLGRPRGRNDDCHVGDAAAHVGEPNVPVAEDVHLPVRTHAGNPAVVHDERHSAWPSSGANQAEAASDDRAKAVGADDEARAQLPRAVPVANGYAGCPAISEEKPGHGGPFEHPRAMFARMIEQDRIEHRSSQRETMIPETAKAVVGDKLAGEGCAAGRMDLHPDQVRRSGVLHALECAQLIEHP